MQEKRLTLKLTLVDERQETHGVVCIDLDETVAFHGARLVSDIKEQAGTFAGKPLDGIVRAMKIREFRRASLVGHARRLGAALADQLEDREGWHNADRQEKVEAMFAEQRKSK